MKNLFIAFLGILLISCVKTEIIPSRPITTTVVTDDSEILLQNMKKRLIGSWDVLSTQTMYPSNSPTDNSWTAFAVFGEVDCDKENQWDYLKTIIISELTDTPDRYRFKVVNQYYCIPDRITTFELRLEKPYNTFLITEKMTGDYTFMIKMYRVTMSGLENNLYLVSREFDTSYFNVLNVGSIKYQAKEYQINIKKK